VKQLPPNSIGDEHLKSLGLGLVGAHRTGKTTIAGYFAKANRCPLVQTSMSAIAAYLDIKIGLDMPFWQRIEFQEEGLRLMEKSYQEEGGNGLFVTDRTPIDLAAYVITAWHPVLADAEQTRWAHRYVQRCIDVTNAYFFQLAVIQPGIPWVTDPTDQKGENIPLYRDNLNAVIIGLCHDERVLPATKIVAKGKLDLAERVLCIAEEYSENIQDYIEANKAGFALQ
jgi:hypothetical protein